MLTVIASLWDLLGRSPVARCAVYTAAYLRIERTADLVIGLSYFSYPPLLWLLGRKFGRLPYPSLVLLTLAFIGCCGGTHFIGVLTGYRPAYLPLDAAVRVATAVVSAAAVAALAGALRSFSRVELGEPALFAARRAADYARVFFLLIVPCVGLVWVGWLGDRAIAGFIDLFRSGAADQAAVRRVTYLARVLRAAESGQRGFLLGGDRDDLEDYRRSVVEVKAVFADVAADPRWSPADVTALRADVRGKLDELEHTVTLAASGRREVALTIFRGGEGRRLMTSIRSRCDRMIRDADARFAIRQEALIRSGSDVRMLVPAVGILGVIALVFAAQQAWVRARAQVVVAQLREEASRAGRWFDMIAHDLRTPLNSISLNLQLAAMSLPGGIAPSIRQVGEAIVEAEKDAKVMAEQIGGFLDIARAQVGKVCLSRFAIGDIVEDACRSVRTAADLKGLCFTVSTPPELTLCSDPGRVRRIVVNLVDNAVKFTEFGAVSVSASARRGGAEICIRDTGPGIAPDLIPRLFGDFQQGGNVERQAEKGFGLGLATCRRLADRIGVEFAVESAPGEGTTFTVSVPDLGDASSSRGRASVGLPARIAGVWSRLRSRWS